jgi:nucleoside-triphosphatase THEP1
MAGFQKARRVNRKARIALDGVSGSGKTFTALQLAKGLAAGGKVAVIDTENESSTLYSDEVDFDVMSLDQGHRLPADFTAAIKEAVAGGYAVLVIDSLSHAWAGALELVDKVAAREAASSSRSKDSFGAWKTVTPEHNKLVDALLFSPIHVIVTMRSKTEYVVTKQDNGKSKIEKLGLKPIQRDGVEYEFDFFGAMDGACLTWTKSRCRKLADAGTYLRPDYRLGETILEWLNSGAAEAPALKAELPADVIEYGKKKSAELVALGVGAKGFGDLAKSLAEKAGEHVNRDHIDAAFAEMTAHLEEKQ